DDALAEPLLQILRDNARAGVDRRPWRERHDELDGLVGIALRGGRRQATEKQNGRDEALCPGHGGEPSSRRWWLATPASVASRLDHHVIVLDADPKCLGDVGPLDQLGPLLHRDTEAARLDLVGVAP